MTGKMSGNLIASGEVREMTLRAVVTRADGRVEDLGVISKYEQPRWKLIVRAIRLRDWGAFKRALRSVPKG